MISAPAPGRGQRCRAKGQAAAEFALVAPILFVLLIGIFEAGRYVLFLESLNHATREGARYAIVNGEHVACPSGPLQPPAVNTCDPDGDNVKQRVVDAASGLAAMGDLFVHDPVWTGQDYPLPQRGDPSSGFNVRGDYVTVFVDFDYNPVIKDIFNTELVPAISISSESSLVVSY